MMRYNPFKPGSVVQPGMFSGRKNEIEIIKKCLFQTKYESPQNFLIQGERGIGKSSLVLYAKYLANGSLNEEHKKYNFIVIKIDLEAKYTFFNIAERLISEIEAEINKLNLLDSIKSMLKSIQTSYISIKTQKTPSSMLIAQIADLLKKISETKDIDGVCLLIDEADKPSAETGLGSFFKLLTERLVTIECNNVCLGIAGLPETIDKLRDSHESSLRIFHILNLKTLTAENSKKVIDLGIKEANEKNQNQMTVTNSTKDLIAQLSEGYPYFLQQFCYNSFEVDDDGTIDEEDIKIGIYDANRGALRQLGEKLFNNMFYDKIDSRDYRKVLQFMASRNKTWITRSDIVNHSNVKVSAINNALQALKERQIILDNPNKKGEYRLPSRSFGTWINIFTKNGSNSI